MIKPVIIPKGANPRKEEKKIQKEKYGSKLQPHRAMSEIDGKTELRGDLLTMKKKKEPSPQIGKFTDE